MLQLHWRCQRCTGRGDVEVPEEFSINTLKRLIEERHGSSCTATAWALLLEPANFPWNCPDCHLGGEVRFSGEFELSHLFNQITTDHPEKGLSCNKTVHEINLRQAIA